ncbi:MAG: hypothetical protein NC337_10095 [Roseburia sp.]|nr:hypothetical protein [Roseburia sp.]
MQKRKLGSLRSKNLPRFALLRGANSFLTITTIGAFSCNMQKRKLSSLRLTFTTIGAFSCNMQKRKLGSLRLTFTTFGAASCIIQKRKLSSLRFITILFNYSLIKSISIILTPMTLSNAFKERYSSFNMA